MYTFAYCSLVVVCFGFGGISADVNSDSGYNFLVIVTDDQDIMLNGMFTTSPICCPSRSSILTGKYAHNHQTKNNSRSGGCYGRVWRETIEPATLPVWLSQAGYDTFFAGKYLNEYFSASIPPGWSQWFGLHGNSRYYNFTVTENGKVATYTNAYFTDYLDTKTVNFLKTLRADRHFFAMVTPPAPHAPFIPADRHKDLFPNVKAIQTPNFNISSSPLQKHWLLTMEPSTLPLKFLDEMDTIHRKRWQTLMAVDNMVENIVNILRQFSQAYDKRQPYETDIRVPLFVRGPTIKPKAVQESAVALLDIVPTILQLANLELPSFLDGQPLPLHSDADVLIERQLLVEYWGEGSLETYNPECPWAAQDRLQLCTVDAACHCQDAWNNTYNCVRHLATDLNFIYCEFKDNQNFVEAYDIANDLYQMKNIGFEMLPSIRAKYSLAIQNLTACVGHTCHIIY
uniref:Sulfatase N-terminal domain-containing protein n=1 Tax=Anopheles melas TaxID=34690 RepID=A0A182TJB5_9DIPT